LEILAVAADDDDNDDDDTHDTGQDNPVMHAIFPCRDHSPINPVNPITQFPESISPEYDKKKTNNKNATAKKTRV
jgi:hypothetical protein